MREIESKLKITSITNVNIGLHQDKSIPDLGHNFVIIYGRNETGKSSISEFISWTIAGPWRTFADGSHRFKTKAGDVISGRMLAQLNEEVLDIDSKFKLLQKGLPSDSRTATLGRQAVGKGKMKSIFNELVADDYRWIYIINGADLSQSKTADDFDNLFSSYTTGLARGGANLREILRALKEQIRKSEKSVRDFDKENKRLKTAKSEASQMPSILSSLEREADVSKEKVKEIDVKRKLLTDKRLDIEAALNFLGPMNAKNKAEFELNSLERVPERWVTVLPFVDELNRRQDEIQKIREEELKLGKETQIAMSKRNFAEGEITGKSLTADERFHLSLSLSRVSECGKEIDELKIARDKVGEDISENRKEVDNLVRDAGLTEHLAPDLRGKSELLYSYKTQAALWASAANDVVTQRANVASIKAAQDQNSSQSDSQHSVASSAMRYQIVIAVALVSGVSLARPIAGVVLAMVVALLAFIWDRKKQDANPKSKSEGSITQNESINNAESRLADAESRCNDFENIVSNELQSYFVSKIKAETASAQVEQLVNLAKLLDRESELQSDLVKQKSRDSVLTVELDQRKNEMKSMLSSRGVLSLPVSGDFENWLVHYEEAIVSMNSLSVLRHQLAKLVKNCDGYLEPVLQEVAGLPWSVIKLKLADYATQAEKVSKAESDLRDAKNALQGAGSETPKMLELLREYPTEQHLRAYRIELETNLSDLSAERDEALLLENEKISHIEKMKAQEVLPGLNLELSSLEESMREAEKKMKIDEVAARIFEKVINDFERDNQDPLIKEAQKLITEVVPEWGDLIFSRVDHKVVIERDSRGVKLPHSSLSEGARALLFLGIRLAFANKDFEKRGIRLPILCDDPFMHFDDDRRHQVMKLFEEIAQKNQIIMFTCEESTRDLAVVHGAHLVNL